MDTMKPHGEEFTLIHAYTRAQALADGVLVDVTPTAKEMRFACPVAITQAVWHGYIVPPPETAAYGQSEEGRLWDVLSVLYTLIRYKAKYTHNDFGETRFTVLFRMASGPLQPVMLKAIFGLGDHAEAVLTIMLPDED